MTFSDLVEYCAKEVYVQAEYNEAGEKQSGVRDLSVYKAHLKHFKEFFKKTLLRDITVAHLKRYRSYRLSCKRVAIVEKDGQKTRVEKTIRPSTVSRELNTLRAMLLKGSATDGFRRIRLEKPGRMSILANLQDRHQSEFVIAQPDE